MEQQQTPEGTDLVVETLCVGDKVDLKSCPFLKGHPSAGLEYAVVESIEREAPDCIAVTYENIDTVGYPVGTKLKGSSEAMESRKLAPEAVQTAFDYIKHLFPQVTQVTYDEELRWVYSDGRDFAPAFGNSIDLAPLEDASDALTEFPITFVMNDAGKLEEQRKMQEPRISPEDPIGMTDVDVVEGAERMARVLLKAWGFAFSGAAVRLSANPRAISAWNVVSAMLEEYNGTDLSSAVDSVDCDVVPQSDPVIQVSTPDPLQVLRNALRFNELGKRHESAEAISAAIGMLELK